MNFWVALPVEQKINLIIAAGTIAAAVFAAFSAILAKRALTDAARAFRAQTFQSIFEYEYQVHFSKRMDTIRKLKGKLPTDAEREDILVVVNFLNHIAHMIRHRYVVPTHVLLLYGPSIKACRDNLLPWLEAERKNESRYYLHFEKLLDEKTAELVWACRADEVEWTADRTCE